jgi:tRNA threonylcarbamoyladenosine biosynthesis protein TsaB
MIDAKRMEVYTAIYDSSAKNIEEISAKIIDETSFQILLKTNKIYFFGNGAEKCKEVIKSNNALFLENIFPSSENLITLAYSLFQEKKFVDIAYFEPYYLKNFIVTISKKNIFT